LQHCSNHGCSKEYYEKDNVDNVCQFHISPPIFHEGLKGWGCCKKRVVDFDEFLAIPGCAFGKHKPTEKKEPKKIVETQAPDNSITVQSEGGIETYTDTKAAISSKPISKETTPLPEVEIPDPLDAVIPKGAQCTHFGCKETFKGDSSRTELCLHHTLPPIFHEGSKGWICCKTRALEWAEFEKILGCTEGKHKFLKDKSKITVRNDFYQTKDSVIVSFYSKNVSKQESSIVFSPYNMHVNLKLASGEVYEDDIATRLIIPDLCKFEILSAKVEVKLKKGAADWNSFSLT